MPFKDAKRKIAKSKTLSQHSRQLATTAKKIEEEVAAFWASLFPEEAIPKYGVANPLREEQNVSVPAHPGTLCSSASFSVNRRDLTEHDAPSSRSLTSAGQPRTFHDTAGGNSLFSSPPPQMPVSMKIAPPPPCNGRTLAQPAPISDRQTTAQEGSPRVVPLEVRNIIIQSCLDQAWGKGMSEYADMAFTLYTVCKAWFEEVFVFSERLMAELEVQQWQYPRESANHDKIEMQWSDAFDHHATLFPISLSGLFPYDRVQNLRVWNEKQLEANTLYRQYEQEMRKEQCRKYLPRRGQKL